MIAKETAGRREPVLLVEDNLDDAFLMERGLKRANLPVELHHVTNGLECMKFLRREAPYADAPRPSLIFLDLNMPVMSGREVLTEIVQDDDLRALPVVVLTTSTDQRDLEAMYRLRCSSYIKKPVAFEDFESLVKELGSYWFDLVVPVPRKAS